MPQLEKLPEDLKKHVTLFRKIEDFQKLDSITNEIKSITIFGGGFLGSELACALGNRGRASGQLEVVQAYQEAGNMGKVLPDYLSEWTTGKFKYVGFHRLFLYLGFLLLDKVRSEGVRVIPNSRVRSVTKGEKTNLSVKMESGDVLDTDHMVVAVILATFDMNSFFSLQCNDQVGIEPDMALASASKLEVDKEHGGFKVNSELESVPNVYVAGDAASFDDPALGRRRVSFF